MTAEIKTEEDRKLWSEWLTKYIGRLERETGGSADIEDLCQYRQEVMNGSNPR